MLQGEDGVEDSTQLDVLASIYILTESPPGLYAYIDSSRH